MALGFHVSKTKTAAKSFENVVVGIDAPVIDSQNRPSTNGDSMTAILAAAKGHYQMLYAVLAGCGPLRAGEAQYLGCESADTTQGLKATERA